MAEIEDEGASPLGDVEAGIKEMLGLFDVPAFARRGMELEGAIARLDERCRRERHARLDMVRMRLRQWAACASGPATADGVFAGPIDGLWPLADAPPPAWAGRDASRRRLRAVGRDLVASVERFNGRWSSFLDGLDLGPIGAMVERYNRYYLLEKECLMRSARLAAQHFEPRGTVTIEALRDRHPTLPVPELRR
jgi:hypothetical protein